MIKHILSCDVGKQGALVLGRYTEEGDLLCKSSISQRERGLKIIHSISMPLTSKEKMEKISLWSEKYSIDIFVIEQQLGRSGNSAQANFTIGKNVGILECIADILGLEILAVYPQTWQTILKKVEPQEFDKQKLDISKKKSLTLALNTFPDVTLAKKGRSKMNYLDGIADAICMQLWYITKHLKDIP